MWQIFLATKGKFVYPIHFWSGRTQVHEDYRLQPFRRTGCLVFDWARVSLSAYFHLEPEVKIVPILPNGHLQCSRRCPFVTSASFSLEKLLRDPDYQTRAFNVFNISKRCSRWIYNPKPNKSTTYHLLKSQEFNTVHSHSGYQPKKRIGIHAILCDL